MVISYYTYKYFLVNTARIAHFPSFNLERQNSTKTKFSIMKQCGNFTFQSAIKNFEPKFK